MHKKANTYLAWDKHHVAWLSNSVLSVGLDSLLKSWDSCTEKPTKHQGVIESPLCPFISFVIESVFSLVFLDWRNALAKRYALLLFLAQFKILHWLCRSKNWWPKIWVFKVALDIPSVQKKKNKSHTFRLSQELVIPGSRLSMANRKNIRDWTVTGNRTTQARKDQQITCFCTYLWKF